MSVRFKIVVPFFNAHPWIEKCLTSIEEQSYKNFDVCIIDDASTETEGWQAAQKFAKRNGWQAIRNTENKKALYNIVYGFRALDCRDDDVLVVIDGDDWLFNQWVFESLNHIYSTGNVLLTAGQPLRWEHATVPRHPKPPLSVRLSRSYRQQRTFPFSHLRTFKYVLWKNIRDQDLRDREGNYFTSAWDLAIMFPMVEMAGSRIHYETCVQLVYNDANPLNDFKVRGKEQENFDAYIRMLPKYPVLRNL